MNGNRKAVRELCGWLTDSTFDRYNVTAPGDVEAGIKRRFPNGTVAAQRDVEVEGQQSVS